MENQNQKDENVNQPASPQTPEPASPQPPEPAGPQPPEPVKSQTTKVQETVDRNLAEQAARQKLTDEVIAKREQVAEFDSQAAAVLETQAKEETKQADEVVQPAESCTENIEENLDIGLENASILMAKLQKDLKAKNLREIEMHNAQMDSMLNMLTSIAGIKEVLETMCNQLSDINDTIGQIVITQG